MIIAVTSNPLTPSSLISFNSVYRYWHTVRYLRPDQIFHQVRHRLIPPKFITNVSYPAQPHGLKLVPWPSKNRSYFGGGRFRFLNQEKKLGWPINWEPPDSSSLWKYNLHYFDYLHQPAIDFQDGLALIRSWIERHAAQKGNVGWEPYSSSLRLVNWIKFFSRYDTPPEDVLNSLLLQTINLQRQVEYHLLGNHLFKNGKALCFAGIFLGDKSIEELGCKIILRELAEQFLPDGGHFELSPMYHSILLEDLLDLINLYRHNRPSHQILPPLREKAGRALGWLEEIIDSEGRIPLLNDASFGVASPWEDLKSYAQRLELSMDQNTMPKNRIGNWSGQNHSGYWVLKQGPFRLIFDAAPLGPDYLPGHSHCDMLSILLDFKGENILTDTGVFEYEEGDRRQYVRSTSAHNTVTIDGLEQAELWKSFRVGRRGHPKGFRIEGQSLNCSHTGFNIWKKGLFHERTVSLLQNGFELKDQVTGAGNHSFQAFFHFAPEVRIEKKDAGYLINDQLFLTPWGAEEKLKSSEYYPEFGKVQERPCLVMEGRFLDQAIFGLRCTYSS